MSKINPIAALVGAAAVCWFFTPWLLFPMLALPAAESLVRTIRAWRHGAEIGVVGTVVNVILVASGFVVVSLLFSSSTFWASIVALAAAGMSALLMGPPVHSKLRAAGGRTVTISTRDILDVTISWDSPTIDGFRVHGLPGGLTMAGSDAAVAFTRLHRVPLTRKLLERAHVFVQSVGGLPGVFNSLSGLKVDLGGRIPVVAIPALYVVALGLEFEARSVPLAIGGSDLRRKLTAAGAVAELSEKLDAELVDGGILNRSTE